MADENSATGNPASIGVKGTPIVPTAVSSRNDGFVGIPLAQHNALSKWQPKVADFIIFHGWIRKRWYGVINAVDHTSNQVHVVREGLPLLLLTMERHDYQSNTVTISIAKIRDSVKGTYHILQGDVWYI